ncbi:MAG TPA: hypothetical protein VLI39_09130 [Sedimentisphaerales bacterium]|nr:hypothetical protein [Sedimentisphaerales bacterium]
MPTKPTIYTPQRIAQLRNSMEKYFFGSADTLFFESWAVSEGIHMRQVRRLVEADEGFAETFERCGAIQASRLLEGSTRPMPTTGNHVRYAVNPRTAILVLQAKHSYNQRSEVTISEAPDGPRLDSPEACDEAIRQAQERKQQLAEMLEQARTIGSIIVGG